MTTQVPSEYQNLINITQKEEEDFKKQLIIEQKNKQLKYTEIQKKDLEKYSQFLTFKAYGEGAFGQVTEYFDLISRKKMARKQFKDVKDLKLEYEIYLNLEKKFPNEDLKSLIACIVDIDVDSMSIFYEQGQFTLNDFMDKRRRVNIYWFNKQEQLGYLIKTIFDLIMKLYNTDIYHGDLKPQNIIIYTDENDQIQLKLIDVGGVTFDHNYLIAITPSYFPNLESFPVTESKLNRIKAEFYQLGRIIQELCLSSVHSYLQQYYALEENLNSYSKFKQKYFQNTPQSILESIELLQQFYSEEICTLLKNLLELNSNPEQVQKLIDSIPKIDYFQDDFYYSQVIIQEKEEEYFQQLFSENSGQNTKLELEFYYDFELEEQGQKKIEQLLIQKYKSMRECEAQLYQDKLDYEDSLMIIYLFLYSFKIQNYEKSDDPLKHFMQNVVSEVISGNYGDRRMEFINKYKTICQNILFHNSISPELRQVAFTRLCISVSTFGSLIAKCREEKDKQEFEEYLLNIFKIDPQNLSNIETLQLENRRYMNNDNFLMFETQEKIINLNKKIIDFIPQVQDSRVQKVLQDQCLLNLLILQEKHSHFLRCITDVPKAKNFLKKIQENKYYKEEFKAQFKNLIESEEFEKEKEAYRDRLSMVYKEIENILEKFQLSSRLRQSGLLALSQQYLDLEGLPAEDQNTYTIKNPDNIQKAQKLVLEAKQLSFKYGSTKSTKYTLYERLLMLSSILNQEKEYQLTYNSIKSLQINVPPYKKEKIEPVQHYEICQNFGNAIIELMKEESFETLKRIKIYVNDPEFQSQKPEDFEQKFNYETYQMEGKAERLVLLQARFFEYFVYEFKFRMESYDSIYQKYIDDPEKNTPAKKEYYHEEAFGMFSIDMELLFDPSPQFEYLKNYTSDLWATIVEPDGSGTQVTQDVGQELCINSIPYNFFLMLIKFHVVNQQNQSLAYQMLNLKSVLPFIYKIKEKFKESSQQVQNDINIHYMYYLLVLIKRGEILEEQQEKDLQEIFQQPTYTKKQLSIIHILKNYHSYLQSTPKHQPENVKNIEKESKAQNIHTNLSQLNLQKFKEEQGQENSKKQENQRTETACCQTF